MGFVGEPHWGDDEYEADYYAPAPPTPEQIAAAHTQGERH